MLGRGSKPRRARPEVKTPYYPFDGGLNLVDAPLDTPEGMVLGGINYEQRVRGGYRRIEGHERYDGQLSPSEASYWTLPFDAGTNQPAINDFVIGQTSLARSCLLVIELDSGSWAGNDAAGTFVLFRLEGTYQNNENLVKGHSSFTIGFDSGFE